MEEDGCGGDPLLHLAVTALYLHQDRKLYVGQGRYLEVWGIDSSGKGLLFPPIEALENGIISGICCWMEEDGDDGSRGGGMILVYGGRQLSLVNPQNGKVINSLKFLDRIIHVSCHQKSPVILIILAHGQVYEVAREGGGGGGGTLCIRKRHELAEDYLIYSAVVIWESLNDGPLIALGTVFHGIDIFFLSKDSKEMVLYWSLRGHEGSIYGISYNSEGTRLASVSDDRTLRIWKLPFLEGPQGITIGGEPRKHNSGGESRVVAEKVLVGHSARIWRVLWGVNGNDNRIFTAAEDSTIRIWNAKTGECEKILTGHIGSNIWSLTEGANMLVSGGDDCSVCIWNLKSGSISPKPQVVNYHCRQSKSDPKCFDIYIDNGNDGGLVTLFSDGTIDWGKEKEGLETKIPRDESSRNAIIKYYFPQKLLLVGNLTGMLLVQNGNDYRRIDCGFHSKIVFLKSWLANDGSFCKVLLQAGNFKASMVKVDLKSNHYSIKSLPINKNTFISSCLFFSQSTLLVGTRDGHLLLLNDDDYQDPDDDGGQNPDNGPLFTLLAHPTQDAITCLQNANQVEFLMTDRSGKLSKYKLDLFNRSVELQWCHRLSKGWLEQVDILNDGSIHVSGFESTQFFLLNFTTKAELVRLEVGGSHRFWQLRFLNDNRFVIGFIRLGQVFIYKDFTGTGLIKSTIKMPLHGAEIKAVHSFHHHHQQQEEEEEDHIISGGEDGRLVLTMIGEKSLSTLDMITASKSGIKCISPLDGLFFIGGSGEEISCWTLSNENAENSGDSSISRSADNGDGDGDGDGVNGRRRLLLLAKAPMVSLVGEARVMDINAVYYHDKGKYLAIAGYSDSFIRVWEYDDSKVQVQQAPAPVPALVKFKISSQLEAHPGHCCLKIQTFIMNERILVTSGGTDGRIVISEFKNDQLSMVEGIHIHQSGINSIGISINGALATGGDDGQVTLLKINEGPTVLELARVPNAHHSTITSIIWIKEDTFVSLSVDQRVKFWKWSSTGISLEHTRITQVGDPAALTLLNNKSLIVVGGGGLERISLFPSSSSSILGESNKTAIMTSNKIECKG